MEYGVILNITKVEWGLLKGTCRNTKQGKFIWTEHCSNKAIEGDLHNENMKQTSNLCFQNVMENHHKIFEWTLNLITVPVISYWTNRMIDKAEHFHSKGQIWGGKKQQKMYEAEYDMIR